MYNLHHVVVTPNKGIYAERPNEFLYQQLRNLTDKDYGLNCSWLAALRHIRGQKNFHYLRLGRHVQFHIVDIWIFAEDAARLEDRAYVGKQ